MGENLKKLFTVLMLVCLVGSGCGRKKTTIESQDTGQSMKNFSMEFFGDSFKANLKGEAAEKQSSNNQASVTKPSLEIKSKNFIVEIKTGSKGTGDVFLDSETQNVIRVVITNDITIIQKNPDSLQVNFSATCGRLTYFEKEQIVMMEESPVLKQGVNEYKADKIVYNLNENRLRFEGNVRIFFKKEAADNP
ncbi:MAG TPA: LptA/OstA family protein [bacterium]|nr:LptA/OstA family protein [bacterium]